MSINGNHIEHPEYLEIEEALPGAKVVNGGPVARVVRPTARLGEIIIKIPSEQLLDKTPDILAALARLAAYGTTEISVQHEDNIQVLPPHKRLVVPGSGVPLDENGFYKLPHKS